MPIQPSFLKLKAQLKRDKLVQDRNNSQNNFGYFFFVRKESKEYTE